MLKIAVLAAALAGLTPRMGGTYVNGAKDFRGPSAYADPSLKTLFYVESDGRHLSAIDFDGKVRWTRDPFVDAKLRAYRVAEPKIVGIGAWRGLGMRAAPDPKVPYIAIEFNSSQFGIVNVQTGAFKFLGQD